MRLLIAKIWYGIRNNLIDLKYGAPLKGWKPTEVPGQASVLNGDYSLYTKAFAALAIKPNDVIVDVGSGRGRFINWTLHQGLKNRVIGLEYDKTTAERSAKRLARYANVSVLNVDATEVIPDEGTVFFVFNPFERELMIKFKDRIKRAHAARPDFTILYLRPLQLDVFKQDPDWIVQEGEIPVEALDIRWADRPSYRQYAVIRLR